MTTLLVIMRVGDTLLTIESEDFKTYFVIFQKDNKVERKKATREECKELVAAAFI